MLQKRHLLSGAVVADRSAPARERAVGRADGAIAATRLPVKAARCLHGGRADCSSRECAASSLPVAATQCGVCGGIRMVSPTPMHSVLAGKRHDAGAACDVVQLLAALVAMQTRLFAGADDRFGEALSFIAMARGMHQLAYRRAIAGGVDDDIPVTGFHGFSQLGACISPGSSAVARPIRRFTGDACHCSGERIARASGPYMGAV
jgi:hypothetical protein